MGHLQMKFLHGLVGPGNELLALPPISPVRFPEFLDIFLTRPGELLLNRLGRCVGPIREYSTGAPTLVVGDSLDEEAQGRGGFEVDVLGVSTKLLRRLLVRRLLPRRWWLRATAAAPLGGQTDADPPGRTTAGTAGRLGHGAVL